MKVRIVCYEDPNGWIVGKFAIKLNENLNRLGIKSDIDYTPDKTADINHHLVYLNFNGKKTSIDTLMITHVDDLKRFNILKNNIIGADLGICMSKDTMLKLEKIGIQREKLAYVNPATDQIIKPRHIILGTTTRVYDDGRKREYFMSKLAEILNPSVFSFKIMGAGWDPQIEVLRHHGFTVEYYPEFNLDIYIKLIPSFDYYFYFGTDEGQMGYVDALNAGVKTIVTPQGFHLDAENGLTYPFTTYIEFVEVLRKIEAERNVLVESVSSWTWENYTLKHLELWKYLLDKKNYKLPAFAYTDGINSLPEFSVINNKGGAFSENKIKIFTIFTKKYLRYIFYKIKHKLLNNKELRYSEK